MPLEMIFLFFNNTEKCGRPYLDRTNDRDSFRGDFKTG